MAAEAGFAGLLGEEEDELLDEAAEDDLDGWPFAVELVPLADMIVDDRYQRPVQERFVTLMAEDFDETLVGCIDVSRRDGSTNAILDGQQRYAAMLRVGKKNCYAAVFTGMELEDEAGFFYRKNKDRQAMRGYYGFRARAVAGDLDATAISDVVGDEGFALGPVTDHADTIGAIYNVERAWSLHSKVRSESLTPTLRTIRSGWHGKEESLSGRVISGLAAFWAAYADEAVEDAVLRRAMRDVIGSPRTFIELGHKLKAEEMAEAPLPRILANVLLRAYEVAREGRGAGLDPLPLGATPRGEE